MAIKYDHIPSDFAVLHQPQNADLKPQQPDVSGPSKGDRPMDMPEFPVQQGAVPFNLNTKR